MLQIQVEITGINSTVVTLDNLLLTSSLQAFPLLARLDASASGTTVETGLVQNPAQGVCLLPSPTCSAEALASGSCAACQSGVGPSCECIPGFFRASGGAAGGCVACQPGQFKPGYGSDTPCQPCPAGSYAAVSGSTVCSLCPPSTYASVSGATACSTCPALSTPVQQNSSEASAVVAAEGATACMCDPGTVMSIYFDGGGCVPCPPGWMWPRPGICIPCPQGTYSSPALAGGGGGGALACEECPPGTFASASSASSASLHDSATACSACTASAGEYAGGYGSSSCLVCPPERPLSNTTACFPVPVCPPQTFYNGGIAVGVGSQGAAGEPAFGLCQACTVCGADAFALEPCTSDTDTICAGCSQGCPHGLVERIACTMEHDTVCCPPDSPLNGTACLLQGHCPPGSFRNVSTLACQGCPDGLFSSADRLECVGACGAGEFLGLVTTVQKQPSFDELGQQASGATTQATTAACVQCPAGTFGLSEGAGGCRPCQAGTFSGSAGATACAACGSAALAGSSACVAEQVCQG